MLLGLKKNKKLLESFSYLSLIQLANMIMPLITYPYLIRILGAETYGQIVFSQAIIGYFSIIINFGFNISATKEISANRDDLKKLSEITSCVFSLQFLLWLGCLCIFIIFIQFIPNNNNIQLLFLLTFGMTLNELLFPVWFFQGIEKMKFITYINLLSKVIFLGLVFWGINKESDFLLIPIFYTLIYLFCGILSFSIIIFKFKIKIKVYSFKIMIHYLYSSFYLFFSKLALLIKDRTIIVILGIFYSKSIVAYYDLALKLVNIFISFYQNIPTAILPRLMQKRDYKLSKFIFYFTIGISILYYLFLVCFSKQIIFILAGTSFYEARFYLFIVGLIVLVNPLNTLLNYFFILNSQEALVLKSVFVSFVIFMIFILVGYFWGSLNLLLFSMSISGLFEMIYKLILFRKEGQLWKFIHG